MNRTNVEKEFYEEMVAHRLILPSGVPGVFGRGQMFEEVLNRFRDMVFAIAKDDGAEALQFPPTIDRKIFEKSEYLDSFPQLAGSVFSFRGTELQAKELASKAKAGEPWAQYQTMTDLCLAPAACYAVYPTLTGTLKEKGSLSTLETWVFRHEPSPEPTRMQSFRIREFVRAGTADVVVDWRNLWLERGLKLLIDLGLPARSDTASDPFFGRGGKMLAANQKAAKLKFEVLIPVCSEENPTAVCSFNYHQDHFGHLFDIKTADGEVAQTACMGFGMERVVMAMFKHHGFVPAEWPEKIRKQLWP